MEDVMDKKTQAVIGAEETLKIGAVRTWRTVLRRAVPWKTARYTKGDIEALIEVGAIDAVSIKLWNVGGFMKGKEIAALCNANNCFCHIASTPGSRLMEAGQLHFAASTPNMFAGAELGEFEPLLDDPASGLDIVNGKLKVPMGPGLGVKVDLSNARETTP
jgi:L-alanine-DL-glutamate epimerase-like enolase superfamily enzyme